MKKITTMIVALLLYSSMSFSQGSITIDGTKTYQTIEGLGGFTHFAEGTQFSDGYMKQVIDNMGATMFRKELRPNFVNSLDDLNNNIVQTGTGTGFAMTKRFIDKAKLKGDFKYIITVWSPPAYMKRSGKLFSEDTLNYLLPAHYGNYAKYLGLFTKEFKSQMGFDLYAIGLQNEPMFNEPYNSGLLYAPAFASCLKTVGAYFEADNALKGIKFYGAEHMMNGYLRNAGGDFGQWGGYESSKYIQYLVEDPNTSKYLHAFAVHGYSNGINLDPGSATEWKKYADKTKAYNKSMWMTETGTDGVTWNDVMSSIVNALFTALNYGNVSAWTYWVIGDNLMSSDLPDSRLGSVKQYFRFIRPGYVHVESASTQSKLGSLVFKNGTDITIVLLNTDTKELTTTISASGGITLPESFQMYRSSSTEICAYLGKSTSQTYTLPAQSILTLYYKASEPTVQWAPNSPQNVQVNSITETSAKLTWTAPADWTMTNPKSGNYILKTNGYQVYMKDNITNVWTKITPEALSGTTLTYSVTKLKPGVEYTYGIVARDELYNYSARSEITFKTICTTNCPDTTKAISMIDDPSVMVYPVPTVDVITIEGASNRLLEIINIHGMVCLTTEIKSVTETINLSSLPKGMYVVKISSSGKSIFRKIILN